MYSSDITGTENYYLGTHFISLGECNWTMKPWTIFKNNSSCFNIFQVRFWCAMVGTDMFRESSRDKVYFSLDRFDDRTPGQSKKECGITSHAGIKA